MTHHLNKNFYSEKSDQAPLICTVTVYCAWPWVTNKCQMLVKELQQARVFFFSVFVISVLLVLLANKSKNVPKYHLHMHKNDFLFHVHTPYYTSKWMGRRASSSDKFPLVPGDFGRQHLSSGALSEAAKPQGTLALQSTSFWLLLVLVMTKCQQTWNRTEKLTVFFKFAVPVLVKCESVLVQSMQMILS